ncbi:RNA polymerase sigma factor [Micromonospora haikouensis]|uniref:RNA polymerase sigma factor n=1 Tax=Micromonospora haikouensis TaxID=686309 RepID=UPI0037B407EA
MYDPTALPEGVTPDLVDQVLTWAQIRTGLAQLPARQRTALEMHAFGFTSREIAAVLEVAPHAVDGLIFRARTALRKMREGGTL